MVLWENEYFLTSNLLCHFTSMKSCLLLILSALICLNIRINIFITIQYFHNHSISYEVVFIKNLIVRVFLCTRMYDDDFCVKILVVLSCYDTRTTRCVFCCCSDVLLVGGTSAKEQMDALNRGVRMLLHCT